MIKELNLVLPWPPSVNNYKKIGSIIKTRTGKLYQTRINNHETNAFFFKVYTSTKRHIPEEWVKISVDRTIAYRVDIMMYPPNNRRYDLDNRLKVLLDSLVRAHIIADDSQIMMLRVEKRDIITDGQVVMKIFALNREENRYA